MTKSLKILHFADAHLDDRNFEEKEACMNAVVDTAIERQPDLIVFAGDAFHSREVRAESRAAKLFFHTIKRLSAEAPVVVLAGTASHDGEAPLLLDHFHSDYSVMVSSYPEQLLLKQGHLIREWTHGYIDAVISMVPPPTKQFFPIDGDLSIEETNHAIGNAMSAMFEGFAVAAQDHDCPHILVGHFNVAGSMISPTQILIGKDIEVSRGQLETARADLVCLGHIHKAQQIGANIFYPGSTQTNTWGELDDKGFYFHTLSEEPVPEAGMVWMLESEFIRTPSRKRLWIKHDFTTGGPVTDDFLFAYKPEQLDGSVVRVDVKLYKDDAHLLDKKAIENFFNSAGAFQVDISISAIARETVRAEAVSQAVTLVEKLTALAEHRGEILSEKITTKADELETEDAVYLIKHWQQLLAKIANKADVPEEVPA